ncbi:MAG: hypothetical protein HY514_01605 [Candidatus Aenigmarchaeota archaeon]|nr:hypothetical protein [Candidatus Aenigmarchaeota archaeon]
MSTRLSAASKPVVDSVKFNYTSYQAVKREIWRRLRRELPKQTDLFINYSDLLENIDQAQEPGVYNIYRVYVSPSGMPKSRKRIARYTKYETSS